MIFLLRILIVYLCIIQIDKSFQRIRDANVSHFKFALSGAEFGAAFISISFAIFWSE